MSQYTLEELHEGTAQGFLSIFGKAWHRAGQDIDAAKAKGQVFDGPVPPEVAQRIVGWQPTVWKQEIAVSPDMESYELPDRFRTFVGNPNSKRIINIAGDGYNENLHNVMGEAIQAALDAECDIASVICLGDGAHMHVSFKPRDAVVMGHWDAGLHPVVGWNSSLTGAIASTLQDSAILGVCDNTMRAQAGSAKGQIRVKRTRNSSGQISVAAIREALDISFANAGFLVAELERLAQIEVSEAQLRQVLDLWKPLPDKEGRGLTLANKARGNLTRLFTVDQRNVFGPTVAGLWQSHNTMQHWMGNAVTGSDRKQRQAQRDSNGEAAALDAEFLAIVAQIVPEATKALVAA